MYGEPQRGSSGAVWIGVVAALFGSVVCCGGAGAAFFLMRGRAVAPPPAPAPVVSTSVSAVPEEAEPAVVAQPAVAPSADPGAGPEVVNVMMTVVTSTGLTGLPPGATCTFPVTHATSADGLSCRAMVGCNGLHLYGASETNGFFACSAFSTSPAAVVGADTSTTSADDDPSFALDTRAGTVTIADDAHGALGAFRVTGTVTAAAARPLAAPGPGDGYGS